MAEGSDAYAAPTELGMVEGWSGCYKDTAPTELAKLPWADKVSVKLTDTFPG